MRYLAWPLLAVLTLTACLDRTTGPVLDGSFEAFISGDFEDELSGSARFGITPGQGFTISLAPVEIYHMIGLGNPDDVRPEVGFYEVGDLEDDGFFALYVRDTFDGTISFVSHSGELDITTSSPDLLEGTLTFTAHGTPPMEPDVSLEVAVDVTFSAVCASGARCE